MTRVSLFATVFAVVFFFSAQRALALNEFCPSDMNIEPVGAKEDVRATLFGVELTALGPRTLTATLALDTDAGWFTAEIPVTTLFEKDRHYNGPSANFIKRDWVSAIMYIRFPKPVKIQHRWVLRAKATGDDFGWEAQGEVTCEPLPEGSSVSVPALSWDKSAGASTTFTTNDIDRLNAAPTASAQVLQAHDSTPLKSANCADPFADATITFVQSPDYPDVMKPTGVSATTAVAVAIKDDGALADAWIWGPSGYQPFDDATLAAARKTKFKAARAYCAPVPGYYIFKAAFDPN